MMLQTRTFRLLLSLLICALLLSGCATGAGTVAATGGDASATAGDAIAVMAPVEPIAEEAAAAIATQAFPVNEPTGAANEIVVSTVDEFLSAIGSDRTIYLNAGTYALAAAKDYGQTSQSAAYAWTEVYDGYGLVIHDVQNLTIVGHSASDVEINTVPRYANVLDFQDCSGVAVNSVTAGHSAGAGSCAGSVLYFSGTDSVSVGYCDLYGCGTLGVEADRCAEIRVENSLLRECSLGAVSLTDSRYVRIEDCSMTACGDAANPAFGMLTFRQSAEIAVLNCTIANNVCMRMLDSTFSKDVQLLGSVIGHNEITEAAICAVQYSPVVEGCAFSDNTVSDWYMPHTESGEATVQAVSKAGAALSADDLIGMQRADVAFEAPAPAVAATPEATVTADGMREVRVTNVDEFLAAIASNTTMYLADGTYDFSKSADYGVSGGDAYHWEDVFDGPGLILENLTNFHIVGNGADKAFLNALPRYADVLCYRNCENVSITGATLGHFKARGECCGGVLRFTETNTVAIRGCGLFGCGIFGIDATDCSGFTVEQTEIYDCSINGVSLSSCKDMAFTGCNIRDCGEPMFQANRCENVTVDGKAVASTQY